MLNLRLIQAFSRHSQWFSQWLGIWPYINDLAGLMTDSLLYASDAKFSASRKQTVALESSLEINGRESEEL